MALVCLASVPASAPATDIPPRIAIESVGLKGVMVGPGDLILGIHVENLSTTTFRGVLAAAAAAPQREQIDREPLQQEVAREVRLEPSAKATVCFSLPARNVWQHADPTPIQLLDENEHVLATTTFDPRATPVTSSESELVVATLADDPAVVGNRGRPGRSSLPSTHTGNWRARKALDELVDTDRRAE